MNLKAAIKYRLHDNRKAILNFYIVILIVISLIFLLSNLTRGKAEFRGTIQVELISSIFLFVVGLNSFKEIFLMFMQNGISRRTMFISQVVSTLTICGIMALIDSILAHICKVIIAQNGGLYSQGIVEKALGQNISSIGIFLISFLLSFFVYIALTSLGFFITTLYYRMNKALKIAVSIGVPSLLFVVLPAVDDLLLNRILISTYAKIMAVAFGNVFMCMLSCFIMFGLFEIFSWLLARKAVVKD